MHRRIAVCLMAVLLLTACQRASQGPIDSDPGNLDPATWKPQFTDGKLQPLPNGFPSQPITLLNPDDPGAPDGLYTRAYIEALRKISPVQVRVVDRSDFGTYGTWDALKWMERQPGGNDGYINVVASVVGGSLDLISTPVVKELNVTLDDFNFVIATELTPFILTQRKNPPWGSTNFTDMVNYVKAHPGEVRYVCFSPGSGRDISWLQYSSILGLKFHEPCVYGDSSQGVATIIGSGEGDLGLNSPDQALVGYEAGRIDAIMATGTEPVSEPWPNIPNGKQAAGLEDDPWGVTRGWAVTKQVPDIHRQWLFELFKAAQQDEEFKQARLKLPGTTLFTLDHDQARARAESALSYAEPILRQLGLYQGQ
jgi:tripartite-type tricarboxylate transporter receptor subunit TctC